HQPQSQPPPFLASRSGPVASGADGAASIELSIGAAFSGAKNLAPWRLWTGTVIGQSDSLSGRVWLESPPLAGTGWLASWRSLVGCYLDRTVFEQAAFENRSHGCFCGLTRYTIRAAQCTRRRHSLLLDASARQFSLTPEEATAALADSPEAVVALPSAWRLSLRHKSEWDARDCPAAPASGWLIRCSNELAAFDAGGGERPGDIGVLLRHRTTAQAIWRLPLQRLLGNCCPSLSARLDFCKCFAADDRAPFEDRFPFGGAAAGVRGFAPNRAGPSFPPPLADWGSGDNRRWFGRRYVGGLFRLSVGSEASIATPLAPSVRLRAFVDAGCVASMEDAGLGVACGLGAACPVAGGAARLELNWCWAPWPRLDTDAAVPGLSACVLAE
ncbi:hypothetical protein BOX15_Mlig033198g1, partial [Macrostomum lignano]